MKQENDDIAVCRAGLLTVQEAAKQFGAVVPLLQAAYFAIISMSDLKKVIWGNWVLAFVFSTPALLWLISLFLAIRIFVPPLVSPEATKTADAHKQTVQANYCLLRRSYYFLLMGLLLMIINVIVYFVYIPLPPSTE